MAISELCHLHKVQAGSAAGSDKCLTITVHSLLPGHGPLAMTQCSGKRMHKLSTIFGRSCESDEKE